MGTYPLLLRVVHPVDLVPGVEDGLQPRLGLRLGLKLDHLGLDLDLDHFGLDLDYLVAHDHAPVAHFLQRPDRVAPVHIGSDNHGPAYPVIGFRHRRPPWSLSLASVHLTPRLCGRAPQERTSWLRNASLWRLRGVR